MIKTLINVSCAEKGKALPYTGKVVGEILGVNNNYLGELLGVNFEYKKEDGTILLSDVKVYTYEQANGLYNLVKSDLTPNLSYSDMEKELFEMGFKIEMASTFGISVEQIETIQ